MAISFQGLSKRVRLTEDDVRALEAIAQGYPTKGEEDRFILVENPKYRPDNGSDPYLVLNLPRIFQMNELYPKETTTEPEFRCDRCGLEGLPNHGCPYEEEIGIEGWKGHCNCCENCRGSCADDV